MLLGWFALSIECPFTYTLSPSSGIVESKNVSDEQMMSILFALISALLKAP